MFYNPSTIQDAYDENKFSSHSIDKILSLCLYKEITGQNTKRTYAETLSAKAQEYHDLIGAYSDDPILFPPKSHSITSIAFWTHCNLTPREQNMPLVLFPKENSFIAAYRGQLYHRLNARSKEPAIFCPFLGFRTINIIKKTLENTTQLAQMVINQPLKKHSRLDSLN